MIPAGCLGVAQGADGRLLWRVCVGGHCQLAASGTEAEQAYHALRNRRGQLYYLSPESVAAQRV